MRYLVPASASLAALLLGGCFLIPSADSDFFEGSRRWIRIYSDTNYVVSIDTAHLGMRIAGGNIVWYRTQHRRNREHERRLWNREVIQSVLRCETLEYRVRSVDLSDGGHPPVSRQRTTVRELLAQPWRDIALGTPDELTARAACYLIKAREP
jgi:hypothetical protein